MNLKPHYLFISDYRTTLFFFLYLTSDKSTLLRKTFARHNENPINKKAISPLIFPPYTHSDEYSENKKKIYIYIRVGKRSRARKSKLVLFFDYIHASTVNKNEKRTKKKAHSAVAVKKKKATVKQQ